jgi:hypothetical protein
MNVTTQSTDFVRGTVRTGVGIIESAATAATEIPLTVLQKLGVSDSATGAVRDGNRQIVQGLHGAVDAVTSRVSGAASGAVSTFTGLAGGILPKGAAAEAPAPKATPKRRASTAR